MEKLETLLLKLQSENTGVRARIGGVAEVFQKLSGRIKADFPQLTESCRDIFRDVIISGYDRRSELLEDPNYRKEGGSKKGVEKELIPQEDFKFKVQSLIGQITTSQEE